MNKVCATLFTVLTICVASMPTHATYNATVIGTLSFVQQMGPNVGYTAETISFQLSNQPSVACGSFQNFVISPTSVPDAQTRKNMLAILITAKASDAQVQVAYDSTGGYCDQGMPAVYYLVLR